MQEKQGDRGGEKKFQRKVLQVLLKTCEKPVFASRSGREAVATAVERKKGKFSVCAASVCKSSGKGKKNKKMVAVVCCVRIVS